MLAVGLLIGPAAGRSPLSAGWLAQPEIEAGAKDPGEVAALLALAREEYALGVSPAGEITNRAEYEETGLFLEAVAEALPGLRAGAPESAWLDLAARVDSARAVVTRVGAPAELGVWVDGAVDLLSREWGARLVEWPGREPSLAAGARLYAVTCASCHGPAGRGDGALAAGMDPRPTDFTDGAFLESLPDRIFQVISYGIRGTAMAGWRDRLSVEERWDLTAYVRALGGDSVSVAAHVRGRGVDLAVIRGLVSSAVRLGRAGEGERAAQEALAAYLEFEKAEAFLRAREPGLTASLERDFLALRSWVRDRPGDLTQLRDRLDVRLSRAEAAFHERPSRWSGAVESLTILVREGFEAMLIVGALLAFLTKLGHRERRRALLWGVYAAIAASVLTAVAIEWIFHWGPASQEALEGITMLLATAVLFSVSYWLVSKVEHAAWERYIRGKIRSALDRGSGFALAAVGFLAVYREGFETILFYKALLGSGASARGVVGGIVAGLVILAALFMAFYRFGVRIPLRPFFAVTSGVLYYMAFVFAGKGIHELQEAGWMAATWVSGVPYLDWLGIYPTVETLAAQGALLVALVLALAWVFVARPLRARLTPAAREASEEGSPSR